MTCRSRGIVALSLSSVLLLVACGRSPAPAPEPEPDPEPDPALITIVREAKESCRAVTNAIERIQNVETTQAAERTARFETTHLKKLREQLPPGAAPRSVTPEVAELLQAIGELAEMETRFIEAIQAHHPTIPYDQLLIELRRYTDELYAIRGRVAPAQKSP
jgi:hypothetical protein